MSARQESADRPRVSRAQRWRRRRLEMREAVRDRWTRMRNLGIVPASIVTVVGGVVTGIVLYEAWLTSLVVAIILGLLIWGWVFLGIRAQAGLDAAKQQARILAEPRRKWLYPLIG